SLFFGRSRLIADLAEQVRARPLTLVLGASGTGKSSVVKAGLLPELRADPEASWTILPPLRPGRSPLASLASLEIPGDESGTWAAEPWLDAEALANRLR